MIVKNIDDKIIRIPAIFDFCITIFRLLCMRYRLLDS
jgi:hypothetical protein